MVKHKKFLLIIAESLKERLLLYFITLQMIDKNKIDVGSKINLFIDNTKFYSSSIILKTCLDIIDHWLQKRILNLVSSNELS